MQLRPPRSPLRLAAVCAALLVLTLPGPASADHVSATFSATAKLGERSGKSWVVDVEWSITCTGASSPLYFGTISLVDQGSGESIFLGSTAGASGKTKAWVPLKTTPRTLKPRMNSSCGEPLGGHGPSPSEFFGSEVVVPALSCDPDLLAKALREFEVAKSFYDAATQDVLRGYAELRPPTKFATQKAAMTALVQTLKKELTEKATELAGKTVVAVGTRSIVVVSIGKLIIDVSLKQGPAVREALRWFREAEKDLERAEEWSKRAEADLDAALRQGPCIGPLADQYRRALEAERKQDAARALIETWENNGYLYLNPATGELLDEAAALREARRVLAGGERSTQAHSQTAKPPTEEIRRLRVAIAKLTRARTLQGRVQQRVERSIRAGDLLLRRLRPLLR